MFSFSCNIGAETMTIIQIIRLKLRKIARVRLARKLWSLMGDVSVDGGADEAFEMRRWLEQWCEKKDINDYS